MGPRIFHSENIFPIGSQYGLSIDPLNITLYLKQTSGKARRDYWKPIGYYPSFAWALRGCLNHRVCAADLKDLKQIVQEIEDATKEIREAVVGIDGYFHKWKREYKPSTRKQKPKATGDDPDPASVGDGNDPIEDWVFPGI